MKYIAHKYQELAIQFILKHPIAVVLFGMGLGKTSLVADAINQLIYETHEVRRVLVIAPRLVSRYTWPTELEKWDHLRRLRYSVVTGTEKQRRKALEVDADIYMISRDCLPWLVEKSGIPFNFDMVVVDELSSFKNPKTKRFKALMKVRPGVKRIVGLTGTPTSNGLMDLFGMYKVMDMGKRLGRNISQYQYNYFVPDRMRGRVVYNYKLRPGADKFIYDQISDITISMNASDYLDMPKLINLEYPVYMEPKEKKKYQQMKENLTLALPGGEVTAVNAAALSNKLMQMSNGAVYNDEKGVEVIHDRKLDGLQDILEAAYGKSVLVGYWFKHDRARIEERLQKLKLTYGVLDNDESLDAWNAGRLQVGLIHPLSAGHGLNLQAGGNILCWYSIPWGLEAYQQTVARLWRQGQEAGVVIVQHIVTEETIDRRILKALENKDVTQQALLDAVKAEVAA